MTGSDNPDKIWKPSKVFKKWDKEEKIKKRKPKNIPKGFLWDPKARELIDTRCNNPKLRKLCRESVRIDKPALCMSPFFTGKATDKKYRIINQQSPNNTFKQYKKKEVGWIRYPHIPLLITSSKTRRMLLGKRLFWTIKEDGENVTIWLKKKKRGESSLYDCMVGFPKNVQVGISSHNQEVAASDITARVQRTKEYSEVLELIKENPTYRVIVEECRKGRSVTGIKIYDREQLIVVDIFDTAIMNFLPYVSVYQNCYHHNLPVVKLFGETRHRTMKDLVAYADHVLKHCDAIKEEGMVVKTFDKDGVYIQAKVKLDIPKPVERKIREGQVILPQIPENEIYGAISHVEADFRLDGTPAHDMPLIAKSVAEECKKHLYSSRSNLFQYYKDYMERMKK
jgi:hypothetical protein